MAKGLPLFPIQLVVRVRAFGRAHDEARKNLQHLSAFSAPNKDAVIVVLKDRIEPGSEKRKIYPEVSNGGVLHIQANECGPFAKVGGSYAQVVCNEAGERMKPLVNFRSLADAGRGHVVPGGHVAIFDAPSLVVVKGYQETSKITITKFVPVVEDNAASMDDQILYFGELDAALPENLKRFTEPVAAVRSRLRSVACVELMYGSTE